MPIAVIGAASIVALAAIPGATALAATSDIIAPQNQPHTPADGWQAGTCKTDTPQCTVETPEDFFEEASAHPQVGFTQFTVKYTEGPLATINPVGAIGKVRVDLPVGLTVNPQATPQCEDIAEPSGCATDAPLSQVGVSAVTLSIAGVVTPPVEGLTKVPVYNLVPEEGQPALFGLELAGSPVYLKADVAWDGDYHEGFTIDVPEPPILGAKVLTNRLTFDGRSGDGTFITTPATCLDPEQSGFEGIYSTWLLAASHEELASAGYTFPQSAEPQFESPLPEGKKPIDCARVPYEPSLEVDPGQPATDSPSGAITDVQVPHITGGGERESSQTKRAEVTLPDGMGIDPSAANGLVACTEEQFGKGTGNPVACPPDSKIGTVAIETPPLPPGSLTGDVYVGRQKSSDPASGDLYRLFVVANSQRFGISARLIGNVMANPLTGRLTTVFDDGRFGRAPLPGLPEVPFTSFRLDFNDGQRAPLTSPPTCGPNAATTSLIPWTEDPPATPSDEFTLTAAPGGGPCAATMAARPFSPGFKATTENPKGGAYSPFRVQITRAAGQQELKGATVDLPPGLTAKLAGLKYCPASALAAAAANSGGNEAAVSSCPNSSFVGTATVHTGSGEPLQIGGKVFLAGPYAGAPLSLAVVTPATAGPFDLGSVVLRVALMVNSETAQVAAVSDPIPHVFGGALLDISSVDVSLDRKEFSLDGTNCSPMAVGATLRGGGADPTNPAAFTAFPASVPYQWNSCQGLGFKPKLALQMSGATKRAKNPKLKAVLTARNGDANIGSAVVTLPKGLILDQSNIARVCTRTQFAANACPSNSRYGFARAFTPLLDKPLEGPVRLRSSDNLLPDLVASLHGQIDVDLAGKIDTSKGRIRNSFSTVPDVPVTTFELTVRGGKKGILTNSRNICAKKKGKRKPKKLKASVKLFAQNGKRANNKHLTVKTPCGKKHKQHKRK
ncbi:MAG TPA: hypothetical protein VH476_01825 [Solirubrobacterales bacterium]